MASPVDWIFWIFTGSAWASGKAGRKDRGEGTPRFNFGLLETVCPPAARHEGAGAHRALLQPIMRVASLYERKMTSKCGVRRLGAAFLRADSTTRYSRAEARGSRRFRGAAVHIRDPMTRQCHLALPSFGLSSSPPTRLRSGWRKGRREWAAKKRTASPGLLRHVKAWLQRLEGVALPKRENDKGRANSPSEPGRGDKQAKFTPSPLKGILLMKEGHGW